VDAREKLSELQEARRDANLKMEFDESTRLTKEVSKAERKLESVTEKAMKYYKKHGNVKEKKEKDSAKDGDSGADPALKKRLKELEEEKKTAAENEDFKRAAELKKEIARVAAFGHYVVLQLVSGFQLLADSATLEESSLSDGSEVMVTVVHLLHGAFGERRIAYLTDGSHQQVRLIFSSDSTELEISFDAYMEGEPCKFKYCLGEFASMRSSRRRLLSCIGSMPRTPEPIKARFTVPSASQVSDGW